MVSTIRYQTKNIIDKYSGVLNIIKDMNVYRYSFIEDDNTVHIGVIAQEILPLIPEVVSLSQYKENSYETRYSVDYATLGAIVSIQGVKELYTRFLPVENEVTRLKIKFNIWNRRILILRNVWIMLTVRYSNLNNRWEVRHDINDSFSDYPDSFRQPSAGGS